MVHPRVWRVDADTMMVHKVAVTLGELTGAIGRGSIEGLENGDLIVVSGVQSLHREGMQVRRLETP